MIPKFRAYLNESVWGDLRKKSLGREIRNEDIVDFDSLDGGTMDNLYNYIIQNYEYVQKPASEYKSIRQLSNKNISIPITLDGGMMETIIDYSSPNEMEFIIIRNDLVKYLDDEAYSRYFDYVEKDNPTDENTKIIVDGDYFPKKNMIGIIDALLENVPNPALRKKRINESVWGDLRKKSLGQEERKETSIDEYSIDTFFKYLQDTYDTVSDAYLKKGVLNSGNKYIVVTIFIQGQNHIDLFYNDGKADEINFNIMKHEKFEPLVNSRIKAFISIIKDVFVVRDTHPSDKQQEGYGIKSSKEYPKGKNTLFVKVLNMAIISFSPKTKKDSYMAIKPKDPNILNESVWGDFRKKSLGLEKRIENDVNKMDMIGFYNYLKDNYVIPKDYYLKLVEETGLIQIPLCQQGVKINDLFYKTLEKQLYLHTTYTKYLPISYKKIGENYNLAPGVPHNTSILIYPKDNIETTNSFCIEVLDFIIDNMESRENNLDVSPMIYKNQNESVWGDLRKKSLGQEVRVENDIDLMDIDGFMEYLKNRYICTKARRRWKVEHWFLGGENTLMQVDIPIEDISEPGIKMTYCLRLTYDYGKKECIDIASSFQTFFEEYPEFKKYVSDNYQLIKKSKEDFRSFGSDNLIVSKPGKELKFHDYVELIDKALSCVKKPYLKMAMNESVWGDIRKKSLGQEERIEDSVNNLNTLEFLKYLGDNYEVIDTDHGLYDIKNSVSSASLVIPILKDRKYGSYYNLCYRYYPKLKYLYMGDNCQSYYPELFKKLKKSFNVRDIDDGLHHTWITPLDGSECDNSFCIKMIEFILKNTDKDDLGLSHK